MKPLKDLIAAKGREWWIKVIPNKDPEKLGDRYVYDGICTTDNGTATRYHVTEAAHADKLRAALLVAVEALEYDKAQWEAIHSREKRYKHFVAWQSTRDALTKIQEIMESK